MKQTLNILVNDEAITETVQHLLNQQALAFIKILNENPNLNVKHSDMINHIIDEIEKVAEIDWAEKLVVIDKNFYYE